MQLNKPLVLMTLAFLAVITACHSTKDGGSANFASITVTNRERDEIRRTAEQVFLADGYRIFSSTAGEMVFEKEASRMNQLAYGGLISTQESGVTTWIRVKGLIADLGDGVLRLQCQAYVVSHHGDSFFEEEKRVASFRSGPYQELLNQVKTRLMK